MPLQNTAKVSRTAGAGVNAAAELARHGRVVGIDLRRIDLLKELIRQRCVFVCLWPGLVNRYDGRLPADWVKAVSEVLVTMPNWVASLCVPMAD